MSENPLDMLNFRAFRPAKTDITVDLSTRFESGERLILVHFRATEADILLVERKRQGWAIRSQYQSPISEASIQSKLEEVSQAGQTGYVVMVIGSGFEMDLPTSLRATPDAETVLREPSAVISQASNNRVYMVHTVGAQHVVVSHAKQTLSVFVRMVEAAGLTVVGVQSSIFGMIRQSINPIVRDARTILSNGAGYVVIDQDETGRIVDLAQFAADNESRISETLQETLPDLASNPNSIRHMTGGTHCIAEVVKPQWEALAKADDWSHLVDDWNQHQYYHLHWLYEVRQRPLSKSWMPVVVAVWVALLVIVGQAGFNAVKIGLAKRQQQQIKSEVTAIEESLTVLDSQNAAMMQHREQCERVAVWIRGRENYQELITLLLDKVPDGVILRSVVIRENRESNSINAGAVMFTFLVSVHPDTPMELADKYFSDVRDRIAANGWFIAESEPGRTQVRILATRRKEV